MIATASAVAAPPTHTPAALLPGMFGTALATCAEVVIWEHRCRGAYAALVEWMATRRETLDFRHAKVNDHVSVVVVAIGDRYGQHVAEIYFDRRELGRAAGSA